jgi:hypothetical protein
MPQDLLFYTENPDMFDALSDEQKDLVFSGQAISAEGDTTVDDTAGNAQPAVEIEETSKAPDAGTDNVVLAKDGKHTIPFAELEKARLRADENERKATEWESVAAQQRQLIESLQQAKAEDDKTGGTESQDAVLAEYQGDFPEIAGDLKPLIQAMIQKGIESGLANFERKIEQRISPVERNTAQSMAEKHFSEISAAHSDYQEKISSPAFDKWLESLPSFNRDACLQVLDRGTASQVVELLNAYSSALPAADQGMSAKDADKIVASAKKATPVSLSDFSAGTSPIVSDADKLESMSSLAVANMFAGKSEAQVNEILRRTM